MPDVRVRLIGGAELKKHIESTICYGCQIGHMIPPCGRCYVTTVLRYIDEMPTVAAQPVKRGHWIETRRYRDADGCIVSDYSCSECGSVLRETNPDDRDSEFYCYHCGAEMDGDAE